MLTTVSHNGIDVDYAYDGQGRTLETKIAGSAIVTNVYTDGTTTANVDTVTATYANGTVIKTTTDSKGRTTSVEDITNGISTQILQYAYDGKTDRHTAVTDGIGNISYSYSYTDGKLDQTSYNVHSTSVLLKDTYNADELLINSKITIGSVSEQYEYMYDDTPEHNLTDVKLPNGTTQNLTRDALGRTYAISQSINGTALTDENRYYLKYGDRTTDNISSVRFGVNGSLDEHIRYKYDKSGNISEIYKNGMLTNRYVYDKLNRMVREDNKEMGHTSVFAYDVGGNILSKSVYAFTLGLLAEKTPVSVIPYSYKATGWRDQMTAFNGEKCEYDSMGRPTTYRNKALTWSKYGTLTSYNGNTYTYDANGVRLTKTANGITTKFFVSGTKILGMDIGTNKLRFRHGVFGVQGFSYNEQEYILRRNIQNDVTHIYKLNNGTLELTAEYKYDAWGKCEVIDSDQSGIGEVNPIRYRGYFYDTETGLYYLNARYYDPETGRFISADDTAYLEPNTVNGLNLYAYCGNNPVMRTDSNGNAWYDWILSGLEIITGALLIATGVGVGFGVSLVLGGIIGIVSNAISSTIGSGLGSMLNGWGAISTGLSLLSFGPLGIIAGVGLMAVGGATMIMGANEVIAGITGTNNLRDWMGANLYNGLYMGLNIASAVGTVAGRLGMRAVGTIEGKITGKAKPYSQITSDYKTTQYNGKGKLYWSIHRTNHGKIDVPNPHWHTGAGRDGNHFGSFLRLLVNLIFRR